jgi:CO/xanthine dehydrogenase Mo-binding subunit
VTYAGGALAAAGRRVTLAELAAEQRLAAGASFTVPKLTYAGCAAAVIVDVDPETGIIELVRVVVGADVGRAVNPALVDAQLVGGVAFGIGNTLPERSPTTSSGQLLSGALMDYARHAVDIPPVDAFYREVPATTSPRPPPASGRRKPASAPLSPTPCAMRSATGTSASPSALTAERVVEAIERSSRTSRT